MPAFIKGMLLVGSVLFLAVVVRRLWSVLFGSGESESNRGAGA